MKSSRAIIPWAEPRGRNQTKLQFATGCDLALLFTDAIKIHQFRYQEIGVFDHLGDGLPGGG